MTFSNYAKTALKNLFKRPATVLYPKVPLQNKERTRGHIKNDTDICIYCCLCAKKCPTGAINVNRADKVWSINRFDCIQCNGCVDCCPKKSLSMENEYTKPDTSKKKEVYPNA